MMKLTDTVGLASPSFDPDTDYTGQDSAYMIHLLNAVAADHVKQIAAIEEKIYKMAVAAQKAEKKCAARAYSARRAIPTGV